MDPVHPANGHWGIRPVLFRWGNLEIPSYSFFIILGIIVGALIYYHEAKKKQQANDHAFMIVAGAFFGSALGAKLLELMIQWDKLNGINEWVLVLTSGRTIIGGLIGGTIGVWITKKVLKIKGKRGNFFAPAIAMGVCIGRIGCFLEGCCYGQPTSLPWGVDFGDGIPRHPTQLYESAFMLILFGILKLGFRNKDIVPGYLFNFLMISYFCFRFLVEFIRTERIAFFHLSYFQIICIFVIIYLIISNKQLSSQKQST